MFVQEIIISEKNQLKMNKYNFSLFLGFKRSVKLKEIKSHTVIIVFLGSLISNSFFFVCVFAYVSGFECSYTFKILLATLKTKQIIPNAVQIDSL